MARHGRREVVGEEAKVGRGGLRVDEVEQALHVEARRRRELLLAAPAVEGELVRERVRAVHVLDDVAQANAPHAAQRRLRRVGVQRCEHVVQVEREGQQRAGGLAHEQQARGDEPFVVAAVAEARDRA